MDIIADLFPPSFDAAPNLLVGQDRKGHWRVQDVVGRLEGCLISRDTALGFARAECELLHVAMRIAYAPLTPHIAL